MNSDLETPFENRSFNKAIQFLVEKAKKKMQDEKQKETFTELNSQNWMKKFLKHKQDKFYDSSTLDETIETMREQKTQLEAYKLRRLKNE